MRLNNKGRSNDEEIFGLVLLFAIFILYKYWMYLLIAVCLFLLYKIILFLNDRDFFSTFKASKIYYQGENGKKKLKSLMEEQANGKNNQYQINCYKKGLYGESRILYTLSNIDGIPMYILYDVALEYNNNKSQIDFIIVTKNGFMS